MKYIKNGMTKLFQNKVDIFFYLLLLTGCISFFYLLVEQVVMTQSFEIYSIRSGDGASFHDALRKVHKNILHFSLFKDTHHFGYNYFFWISYGVVTLPFYLLGYDSLTIISALILTQIYAFGCLFIFSNILKLLSNNKAIRLIILAIALSFAALPFFSLHFYCITPTAFYILLSIYYTLRFCKTNNIKHLRLTYIFIAIAVGHKIVAVSIAPLVCLLMLQSNNWSVSYRYVFSKVKTFFLPLLFLSIFLINPNLLFSTSAWIEHFNKIKALSDFTSTSPDLINHNLVYMIQNGVFKNFISVYSFVIIILIYVFIILQKYRSNFRNIIDNQALLISIYSLLSIVIFSIIVKRAPIIIANYSLPFGFLFLCFLICFPGKKIFSYLLLASVGLSNLYYNKDNILNSYQTPYVIERNSIDKVELVKKMKSLIPLEANKEITIMHNYSVPSPYHYINDNIMAFGTFDNIGITMKWTTKEFDYIILDKKSLIMQSLDVISNKKDLVSKDRFKEFVDSYYIIKDLKSRNRFKNSNYKMLYDDSKILIYQKLEN